MFQRTLPAVSALLAKQPARLAGTRVPKAIPCVSTRALFNTSKPDAPSNNLKPTSISRSIAESDKKARGVMELFRLDGMVIPVTGGARGLGLEMAVAAVEAGAAHVHCLDVLPEPSPDFFEVRKRLANRFSGQLHYVRLDATSAADVNKVIAGIAERHEGVHGCIAAAGINYVRDFVDYPPEEITRLMATNFNGVFLVAQACARQMKKYKTKGSIVLVASMSGTVANRDLNCSVYNSSKAAVVQLARNMAMELGPEVRTNALSPGNVLTPMVKKNFADQPELREKWENGNMLGRIAATEEFKGPAVFLLSEASSFMTGGELRVDGGYTAW